ncbi:unnamed protein product [Caretta caretta]
MVIAFRIRTKRPFIHASLVLGLTHSERSLFYIFATNLIIPGLNCHWEKLTTEEKPFPLSVRYTVVELRNFLRGGSIAEIWNFAACSYPLCSHVRL